MRIGHWCRGRIVSEAREERLVTVGTPSAMCRRLVVQRSSWPLSARCWQRSLRSQSRLLVRGSRTQRWSSCRLRWSHQALVWRSRSRTSVYPIAVRGVGSRCLVSRWRKLCAVFRRRVHSIRSLLVHVPVAVGAWVGRCWCCRGFWWLQLSSPWGCICFCTHGRLCLGILVCGRIYHVLTRTRWTRVEMVRN